MGLRRPISAVRTDNVHTVASRRLTPGPVYATQRPPRHTTRHCSPRRRALAFYSKRPTRRMHSPSSNPGAHWRELRDHSSASKRLQVLDEVGFLLLSQSECEEGVVVLDDIPQRRIPAIMIEAARLVGPRARRGVPCGTCASAIGQPGTNLRQLRSGHGGCSQAR